MNLPYDLIKKIFSYLNNNVCYRCNKKIEPIKDYYYYSNKLFCSNYCIEYQHY